MKHALRNSRGVSLVEIAAVGLIATIVMLALTGFYINSQGAWIEASAQAISQREATPILQVMADSVHAATSAEASLTPPIALILRGPGSQERSRFWLEPSDSRIHSGRGEPSVDQGPLATSTATQFVFSTNASLGLVRISKLELRSSNGRTIQMSGSAALFSR
jgi:hypothetical protein